MVKRKAGQNPKGLSKRKETPSDNRSEGATSNSLRVDLEAAMNVKRYFRHDLQTDIQEQESSSVGDNEERIPTVNKMKEKYSQNAHFYVLFYRRRCYK